MFFFKSICMIRLVYLSLEVTSTWPKIIFDSFSTLSVTSVNVNYGGMFTAYKVLKNVITKRVLGYGICEQCSEKIILIVNTP